MLNLATLVETVQTNCDISDAQHAGDYTLCTYLLKMREYFRWEHEIPYFAEVPQSDLGAWLSARERRWDDVETVPLRMLPLASAELDPFASDEINRMLLPHGYVYSGGYGRFHKPLFFLGRLRERKQIHGFTVLVSSCEYARELAAPPAMFQGGTIYVREESARRFVWEKIDEWQWNKQENAMSRAMAGYDFNDKPRALEAMTRDAMDIMVWHEIGEGLVGEELGERWTSLLAGLSRSRAEIVARAVRDHLADCRSTLPALLARAHAPSLHFYFANLDGVRKELFGDLHRAYKQWVATGELRALHEVVTQDADHWLQVAASFIESFDRDPAQARASMEQLLAASCALKPAAPN